jgi:hypothetical protein
MSLIICCYLAVTAAVIPLFFCRYSAVIAAVFWPLRMNEGQRFQRFGHLSRSSAPRNFQEQRQKYNNRAQQLRELGAV